ncbi:hypothetical protein HMSSN036_82660 [Paenibacillus macerans]|nr:hypothetical protein HMSSN036_82660 [Paenibacillus macerans]
MIRSTPKTFLKFYETNAKYRWKNPAEGLSSETFDQKGLRLLGRWVDTMSKVAMGQLPLSAVDEAPRPGSGTAEIRSSGRSMKNTGRARNNVPELRDFTAMRLSHGFFLSSAG